MNRRSLIQNSISMGIGSILLSTEAPAQPAGGDRVNAPVFLVRSHGAKGDGITKDTAAIQKTVDECFRAGGGLVYLSPGTYLSGTIVLKSNVTFYLEAGATLLGSTDLADYLPQMGPPFEGDANNKHLIFARNAENLTICGSGVVDGQGPSFWVPSGRTPPSPDQLWGDVATYDWKPLPRPSPMVEIVECKNVRIEGVTLKNSPGWTLRPIACDSLIIQGLRIRNPIIGPNTDGIDLTCSQNVFISDCDIATGDDAICLKSENPYGDVRVSRNIAITNCMLTCCCNGFKIGTATNGGFENIVFSNSVIYNGDVPLSARVIAGLAIEMVDGGWIDGLVISNIRMRNARTPIFVRLGKRNNSHLSRTGTYLRGVMIANVHATGAILTSSITGIAGSPVEDVTLSHISIVTEEEGKTEWVEVAILEHTEGYPEARMFGRLPSYGLYCRHVNGIELQDLQIRSATHDPRPLLACDDVSALGIDSIRGTTSGRDQAFLDLRNVRDVFIRSTSAPVNTAIFARVSGPNSDGIVILGNDLTRARKQIESASDVPSGAVTSDNGAGA
jgi:hypothetical protein